MIGKRDINKGTIQFYSIEKEVAIGRQLAAEVIQEANDHHAGRVVTELLPETNYHPAEAYHQHYYARNPDQGYCAFVVAGKVEKFLASFKRLVK